MEAITKFFSKNGRLSFLFSLFFLLIFCTFFYPWYETNDDNFMISILNSAYGSCSENAVYIHVFLSRIIILLQSAFPTICWYTFFIYFSCFTSFISINYTLLQLIPASWLKWALLFVINIFGGYEFYVYPQFTKTAALCGIGGFLLVNIYFISSSKSFFKLFSGCLLMILGSLWRFSSFGMVCIPLSVFSLLIAINYFRNRDFPFFPRYVLTFLTILSLILAIRIAPSYFPPYSQDSEWSSYKKINTLRSQLVDFGFPDYENNQELYNSLNISSEDIIVYKNWNFADTEIFNADNMQQLVNAKPSTSFHFISLQDTFHTLQKILASNKSTYLFFIIIIFFWIGMPNRQNFVLFLSLLSYLAVELYLISLQRYGLPRTEIPLILSLCLVLLISTGISGTTTCNSHHNSKIYLSLVFIISTLFCTNILTFNDISSNENECKKSKEFYEYISQQKQSLFLVENYTHDDLWTKAFGVFSNPPANCADNYYVLGGWMYQTPITNQILSDYNIENPLSDVVDNPNVYYVNNTDPSQDIVFSYIQRHYAPTARLELVKEIGATRIYRIITQ